MGIQPAQNMNAKQPHRHQVSLVEGVRRSSARHVAHAASHSREPDRKRFRPERPCTGGDGSGFAANPPPGDHDTPEGGSRGDDGATAGSRRSSRLPPLTPASPCAAAVRGEMPRERERRKGEKGNYETHNHQPALNRATRQQLEWITTTTTTTNWSVQACVCD